MTIRFDGSRNDAKRFSLQQSTAMPSNAYLQATQSAEYISSILPKQFPLPRIAIICGSGLGGLVSTFHADPQISINYADIPNFPISTVPGHQSRLVFGTIGDKKVPIVAMVGRFHFYEGYNMDAITLPIHAFLLIGIKTLIGMQLYCVMADS